MGQSAFVLSIASLFLVAYPLLPMPITKGHQEQYKPDVSHKEKIAVSKRMFINYHGESKIEKWFDEER